MAFLTFLRRSVCAGPFLVAALWAGGAHAADTPITIELNKLEQADGGCQAYFLVGNSSARQMDSLKLDLVVFDPDGVVARRMAVEIGPVRPNKTTLKVFPIGTQACDGVGRLLLNDILSCREDSVEKQDCLALVSTASRGPVDFIE